MMASGMEAQHDLAASLGKVCSGAGDHATARKFTRESLTLSRGLGNKWVIPYLIEILADIYAKENDAEKAVRLYGAASAQREALALTLTVMERKPYQQAVDRLRELVSQETFDSEWQNGRSMGIQAATELAMEKELPVGLAPAAA